MEKPSKISKKEKSKRITVRGNPMKKNTIQKNKISTAVNCGTPRKNFGKKGKNVKATSAWKYGPKKQRFERKTSRYNKGKGRWICPVQEMTNETVTVEPVIKGDIVIQTIDLSNMAVDEIPLAIPELQIDTVPSAVDIQSTNDKQRIAAEVNAVPNVDKFQSVDTSSVPDEDECGVESSFFLEDGNVDVNKLERAANLEEDKEFTQWLHKLSELSNKPRYGRTIKLNKKWERFRPGKSLTNLNCALDREVQSLAAQGVFAQRPGRFTIDSGYGHWEYDAFQRRSNAACFSYTDSPNFQEIGERQNPDDVKHCEDSGDKRQKRKGIPFHPRKYRYADQGDSLEGDVSVNHEELGKPRIVGRGNSGPSGSDGLKKLYKMANGYERKRKQGNTADDDALLDNDLREAAERKPQNSLRIHPSWEAKRKQNSIKIGVFEGQKIKFDG